MKHIQDLNDHTRYWLMKALDWADERWNDEHSLVQMQFENKTAPDSKPIVYAVRDSVWYATGLFMRQSEGDIERAVDIIETILGYQYDLPETVYHGTFKRYPEEADPPENPIEWRDYDPNWREFICTIFIILLKEFESLIPDALKDKMSHAIQLAAEGSFARKVAAEYTNISLMSAFMLDYAGRASDNEEWLDYALEQAHEIEQLFNRYKTFNEYNSPTYYGVDFYALALWREYSSSDVYRSLGAEMERELWRDTAEFYHADMKNICGPYDRSYGMDMTDYVASVALWIAAALPAEFAPLPDVDQAFDHAGDYYFMPMVALMGTKAPDDVLPHLQAFQGERFLERTIEPNRTATAWLSPNLMLGAEADHLNETRTDQFHPATIHWRAPDASIGWIRINGDHLIQAIVQANELILSCREAVTYSFEIRVNGADPSLLDANQWGLPGLGIQFAEPIGELSIEQDNDLIRVKFTSHSDIRLTCQWQAD